MHGIKAYFDVKKVAATRMGVVKIARITRAFLAISHITEVGSPTFATLLVTVRMSTTPPYSIIEYGLEQGVPDESSTPPLF
jgi:hypothetical protein